MVLDGVCVGFVASVPSVSHFAMHAICPEDAFHYVLVYDSGQFVLFNYSIHVGVFMGTVFFLLDSSAVSFPFGKPFGEGVIFGLVRNLIASVIVCYQWYSSMQCHFSSRNGNNTLGHCV